MNDRPEWLGEIPPDIERTLAATYAVAINEGMSFDEMSRNTGKSVDMLRAEATWLLNRHPDLISLTTHDPFPTDPPRDLSSG